MKFQAYGCSTEGAAVSRAAEIRIVAAAVATAIAAGPLSVD